MRESARSVEEIPNVTDCLILVSVSAAFISSSYNQITARKTVAWLRTLSRHPSYSK